MKDKEREVIKAQLWSIRAQIDAALHLLAEEAPEEKGCYHPKEARLDMRSMGDDKERWLCKICGFTFPDDEVKESE